MAVELTRRRDHRAELGENRLCARVGDNNGEPVPRAILLVLGRLDLLPADSAPLEEQVQLGAADFLIEATLRTDGALLRLAADARTLRNPPRPDIVPGGPFWSTIEGLKPQVEYFSARREPEALGEAADTMSAASVREARRIVELKRRLLLSYFHSLRAGQGHLSELSPFARLEAFVRRFLGDDVALDVLPRSNNPGAELEVVVRRGALPADVTSLAMVREAAVVRKDVPRIVPIDRLSSGEVALFAFAGPILYRDVTADVVLIDEPEQHVHVQWQRRLVEALRELSPQSHFIVATHGLDVLDAALSYERFLLLREDDPRARLAAEDAAAE